MHLRQQRVDVCFEVVEIIFDTIIILLIYALALGMPEGKQYKFCSLYNFVKKHNQALFVLLEDVCAVGLFRPKYPTTFINPSDKLVKRIAAMVDEGETEEAFEHIQKLFIYGQHEELVGELVTYNNKKVTSDLSKLKRSKTFAQWERRKNVNVFDSGAEFPEEGEATRRPVIDRKPRGVKGGEEVDTDKLKATKELFVDAKYESFEKLQHAVAYKVNSLLEMTKKMDPAAFEKARMVLDPNMVVSWYILVKPSSAAKGYIPARVFSEWFKARHNTIKSVDLLKKLFASNDNDTSTLAATSKHRREMMEVEGLEHLRKAVVASYDDKTKLLEDEIRFRYSNEFEFSSFDFSELCVTNWDAPETSLVLFKETPKNCLFKASIHKLIREFVASNAFHYTMFNACVHEKFSATIRGAGNGKRVVNILGTQARTAVGNISGSDEKAIKLIIMSLSDDQVEMLKKALKEN